MCASHVTEGGDISTASETGQIQTLYINLGILADAKSKAITPHY